MPSHRKSIAVAGGGVGALHSAVVDRAGVQRDQVVEAASVEWQLLHRALPHQPRNGGWRGVHNGRFFEDGDGFDVANLELQLNDGILADVEINAAAKSGLKAR